jgi:hypothetical protein
MAAELDAVTGAAPRLAFALSGTAGILRVAARDAASGRVADAPAVACAAGVGLAAAVTDLAVSSRAPAAVIVAVGCFALGARVARAAWRWPLLVGGMLPVVIAITGHAGPYAHDRADRWYAAALAIACTALGLGARALGLAVRTRVLPTTDTR